MKRSISFIALLAFGLWSAVARSQQPKLEKMTFRLDQQGVPTVTCTGNAKLFVTLVFDTAMRDTLPKITFGLTSPYQQFNLPIGEKKWANNKTFVAYFAITPDVPPATDDGLYKFIVSGAVSTGGQTMNPTWSDSIKNEDGAPANLYISRKGKLKTTNVENNKIDFGIIKAGQFVDRPLTIKNFTCTEVTITQLTISEPFSIINPPLGGKILPDASLTISLRFGTSIRKAFTDSIKIHYTSNQQQDSLSVQLAGMARGPKAVFTPNAPINFGIIDLGNTVPKTISVFNDTSNSQRDLRDVLKVTSITINPTAGYAVSPDTLEVAPGVIKNVVISFTPTETKTYTSSLNFVTNDNTLPQGKISFAVSGTGREKMPPPKLDTLLVYWPGGRAGYTNLDFLEICLNFDVSEVKEARWKFNQQNLPPTSPNDTTGTGKIVVAGGKACFKIPLHGVLKPGYWYYYIWLEGKNGVSGYLQQRYSSRLYYDTTPPAFTSQLVVSSGWTGGFPGYTNADYLTICGEASDPSGIVEVRWKLSSTRAKPDNASDTTKFGGTYLVGKTGSNCITVPLKSKQLVEGRWYCYVWLIDGSGNSNHPTAVEIPFKYDLTAPIAPRAPVSRNIPANNWFGRVNKRTLILTLNLPAGARDAASVRWKFKTPPQSTTSRDGSAILTRVIRDTVRFSVPFNADSLCGEGYLYYWLVDSAGNSNQNNNSSAGYKFDMCPPVIAHFLSGEAIATKHSVFKDTITITDHNPVNWDSVLYRFGGARANEPARQLEKIGGVQKVGDRLVQKYVMQIPADGVTTRGIEYKIFAKDTLGNRSSGPAAPSPGSLCGIDYEEDTQDSNWVAVRVRTTGEGEFRTDKDGNPVAQPYGRDAVNYALFSVPFELEKNTPKDVLEDDLGQYDIKKWRFFEYRPDSATNPWVEYNATKPTIAPFVPGRAFFLIVGDAGKVIDSGIGKTVSTRKKFLLELKKGWNLFGNPFNFPISREHLRLVNSSIPQDTCAPPSIRSYERGWNIDDTIEPWKGYALYVEPRVAGRKIELVIYPQAIIPRVGKTLARAETSTKDWAIQIAAKAGTALDTINWVGTRSTAAEEYDDFDQLEPPVIGDYVSVYVPNENWSLHPMKYTADFRPADKDAYQWPIMVVSNQPSSEVNLEFKGMANLPDEFEAYLIDEAYGIARNLRRNPAYRMITGTNGIEKSLKLLVGKTEALQKQTAGIALVPKVFELSQNFPNPFAAKYQQTFTAIRYALPQSATVTVEVYNMLGQKVRTLVDRQAQAADYYLATWDGRDELGKEVSSGVYLYRLLAESEGGKFAMTKKLILVK
ncbi:MAG: choice-of-anchor D domain-containing protein [candidate division KSB1 bacterium]|nr:choice-of-anchor D domain-containing protein [candidate division KSB1 bacterium]MDZ7305331.1 choice-of-anchor D domain-containing protein [candidate division KSB1 bacterium]